MNLPKIRKLLQETFQEWQEDKASRIAAALAYYAVFSLSPLLVIAIAIAGTFFGQGNGTGSDCRSTYGVSG